MTAVISCTPLMCVGVVTILPPRQQALLRSASSAGVAAYEEMVVLSKPPPSTWIETDTSIIKNMTIIGGTGAGGDCVPCTLPPPCEDDVGTLVLTNPERVSKGGDGGMLHTDPGVMSRILVQDRFEEENTSLRINPRHTVSSFQFRGFDFLHTFPDHLITSYPSLTSIDLVAFGNVTTIGSCFIFNCPSLTAIDLSPFTNVTSLGSSFLGWNTSLAAIDLSPLSKVSSIGSGFMSRCTSLTTLNLSPITKVTRIPEKFLSQCKGLTKMDFSGFATGVTRELPIDFMSECEGLKVLDLSPFVNLEDDIPEDILDEWDGVGRLILPW